MTETSVLHQAGAEIVSLRADNNRLRSELASAQTIAARESAEADVQVESRIEAQEELFTARTEIETLRKRIAELQEQAEFHIRLLTGGGSAAYLGELAEAYRLRDAHHTDAIDARLETESLRDELTAKDARIAELDGQNQQMFTASCNLANDLQDARERIAALQGGAERYWEGRWRDELARAERAEAERDALRKNFAVYLVAAYRAFPLETARTCDEELDRSGALLRYVRDAARAALNPSPAGREG